MRGDARIFDPELWRPAPDLSLSAWADAHFYLSPESSAEPGRWRTLPYQRGIMDAITDPAIERVSLMKSARVGGTKMMGAAIGYFMHQDPCPIMVVQPTLDDARGYSQDEITPMLRDCEVLRELVGDPTVKAAGQTIKRKEFPGGVLQLVGANSPTGFRRVSRRVVMFDEVDAYPPSAGADGDPVKLGIKRTEYFHNRKIIAVSTPLLEGSSRIKQLFEEGDQRRFHVPDPHCGYPDFLTFREEPDRGHWLAWDEGDPSSAHFVCRECGAGIEYHHQRAMLEAGEWIAEAEAPSHASFHVWAAYSTSPNSTWEKLAAEFIDVKDKPEQLRVYVNTVLAETWAERGEAPQWERLYWRREPYPIGTVPDGVEVLTAGVDVQKDRLVYEVRGWALSKESWVIEAGIIWGDTASAATWAELDELLARGFRSARDDLSKLWSIAKLAIDSGYATQQVYSWARRYRAGWRVIACKGMTSARSLLGTPSPVELTVAGRKIARGYKVWPVAPHMAKAELYGWLRLPIPEPDEPALPGYVHFPELDEEFFRQLTAEHLVPVVRRNGFTDHQWQLIPGRENHWLDTAVLNRVAAAALGIDRAPSAAQQAPTTPTPRAPAATAGKPEPPPGGSARRGSWLGEKSPRPRRKGSWLKRRR